MVISGRTRALVSAALVTVIAGAAWWASDTTSNAPSQHVARNSTTPQPSPQAEFVKAQAERFMDLLQAGDYSDQWGLMSPIAQSQWPSAPARGSMLKAKFAGAQIRDVLIGEPTSGATWTSPENLVTVSGLWKVPVSITFDNGQRLAPVGAASTYLNLSLYLAQTEVEAPEVIGEGPASLDAPILLPAQVSQRQARVPILMYHRVAPYPTPSLYRTLYDYRLDYGLTVGPAEFAGQVDDLALHGYQAISLLRLSDFLLYGLPLPAKPVIFTFDDGRSSPLEYAVPVLRQHGFTAVFFIPTGLMGVRNRTQQYLTSQQVVQLSQDGFWVEDHTIADNVALWAAGVRQVDTIAGGSGKALQSLTGLPVQFIAYTGLWPYSNPAESGPSEGQLFAELARLGYVGAVVDAREDSNLELSTQLWQLPRIRVNPGETLGTFVSSL